MFSFLQTKRRKTGDDEFTEPEVPRLAAQSRRSSRNHRNSTSSAGSRPPSTLPSTAPPSTELFDQLCTPCSSLLSADDVRMVIIDGEPRRTVMYDSSTVFPLIPGASTEGLHLSPCKSFQLLRKRRDTAGLSQLVWGAMPAPHGADSLKVHQLPDDDKVLLSRVFRVPRMTSSSRDVRVNSDSLPSSDSESQYLCTIRSLDGFSRGSLPSTAPPEQFSRVRNSSLHLDSEECDSETRAFSPPHRLSKNRRIQMSHKNSLCEPGQSVPWKSRSRLSSCGSQPEDESSRQVALGIIFSNRQRAFIFQHMPIVETEVSRLESRITTAAMHKPSFLMNVHKAWQEFCYSLCTLYNSPRLRNPVWLSLAEKDLDDCQVAADFCNHLAALVSRLDTKNTKFFLSNVISTVLMHHMSWVASVASPNTAPALPTAAARSLLIGTAVNDESTSIPYNPHMAQYLEISGSVGNTHRSTKTVLMGMDSEEMTVLLHVLSYFIRCSTVQHRDSSDETQPLPVSQSFSPEAASPETVGSPPIGSLREIAFSPEKLISSDDVDAMSSCSMDSQPGGMGIGGGGMVMDDSPISVTASTSTSDSLGRSLLAGPSTSYSPHFVLSGLIKEGNNYDDAFMKMLDDVRCEESAIHRAAAVSLSYSASSTGTGSSACEVQLPDSVVIMADLSNCTVKVVSSDGMGEVVSPAEAVVSMLEQFKALHQAGFAPKFLVTFLEDRLGEILGKSLSLVEMVSGGSSRSPQLLSPDRVRSVVGCDHSDLRLILNVASVYYPPVLSSVL